MAAAPEDDGDREGWVGVVDPPPPPPPHTHLESLVDDGAGHLVRHLADALDAGEGAALRDLGSVHGLRASHRSTGRDKREKERSEKEGRERERVERERG